MSYAEWYNTHRKQLYRLMHITGQGCVTVKINADGEWACYGLNPNEALVSSHEGFVADKGCGSVRILSSALHVWAMWNADGIPWGIYEAKP